MSASTLMVSEVPDTSVNRRMADGHLIRKGHTLDAVLVSADGVLWHTVRRCCGETMPADVPTWDEATS